MRIVIGRSIRTKLFILFSSVTLILFCGFWGWAYNSSQKAVQRETLSLMKSIHSQTLEELNNVIGQMEIVLDIAAENPQTVQYLTMSYGSPYEEYKLAQDLILSTTSTIRGTGRTVSLSLIGFNPSMDEIVVKDFDARYHLEDHYALSDGSVYVGVYREERYLAEEWYVKIRQSPGYHWLQTDLDQKNAAMSVCRNVYSSQAKPCGVVKLTMPLKDMMPSGNLFSESEYYSYFFSNDGNYLFSNAVQSAAQDYISEKSGFRLEAFDQDNQRTDRNATFLKEILNNGWIIVNAYPLQRYAYLNLSVQKGFFLWMAFLLLAIAIASYTIANYFTKRLKELHRQMEKIGKGTMDVRVAVKQRDEIDQLAVSFNEMAGQIQKLLTDVYQGSLRENQLRLNMLQSQIQPHFLYNTLSAIVRLCRRGDNGSAETVTRSLAQFYRISLSEGRELITLQDELKHVQAYVDICFIRYKDLFTMDLNISPEALSCLLPKIILQPFVENSLEHGMVPEYGKIHIDIQAVLEDEFLIITVADDGCGMKEEAEGEEHNGYGIRNVRERLQLLNSSNQLTISNQVPHGFFVRFSVKQMNHNQ